MPMTLNPYMAGNRPVSPNVSASSLNNLLAMQQQAGEGIGNLLAQAGKIDRTQKVNDLIARGGLDKLNEAQLQEKLLGTAGGSLTKEGQTGIENLLGSRRELDKAGKLDLRQEDQQNFLKKMQEDRQGFTRKESVANREAQIAEQKRKEGVQSGLVQGSYKGANGNMFHMTKSGQHIDSGIPFHIAEKEAKGIKPTGFTKTEISNMSPAMQEVANALYQTKEFRIYKQPIIKDGKKTKDFNKVYEFRGKPYESLGEAKDAMDIASGMKKATKEKFNPDALSGGGVKSIIPIKEKLKVANTGKSPRHGSRSRELTEEEEKAQSERIMRKITGGYGEGRTRGLQNR